MSEARARIYELALRALDEQNRRVDDLRGRLALVLAAGGVGVHAAHPARLLSDHPSGAIEFAAAIVGLLGAVTLVLLARTSRTRCGWRSA